MKLAFLTYSWTQSKTLATEFVQLILVIIVINLAMTTMLTRLVENEEGGKFW